VVVPALEIIPGRESESSCAGGGAAPSRLR